MDYKRFKNNGKLKLLIIVGTRPEIIRLAAVINKCRQYFDCLLAHTGPQRGVLQGPQTRRSGYLHGGCGG